MLLLFAGMAILLLLMILIVPSLNNRVMEVVEGGLTFEHNNQVKQTSLTLRLEKWRCATQFLI